MKLASSYITLMVYLICCGPAQPEVSLRVSPERYRNLFFELESISLTCEEEKTPVQESTVKRQSERVGENGTCGTKWGSTKGASCTINALKSWDSGTYWCQSTSGISRNINIMISDGPVILQSPVHPVPEGERVLFHCMSKDKKTSSDLPAGFFRNGSFIRTEPTGQMTIHHVSKSDEGFYKCNISDLGKSQENWMKVKPPPTTSPTPDPKPDISLTRVLIIKLLVFTPYLISTLLYFSILKDRARARAAAAAAAANARRRRDNDENNEVIMEVAD